MVLAAVKKTLRCDDIAEYDEEIEMLIDACEMDLRIAGVADPHVNQALFTQACIFYCKANFGQGGGDEERWAKCYDLLKCSFALATVEEL